MALIKCPECGHEISDKSKQCIYCGFPLDELPLKETISVQTNDTEEDVAEGEEDNVEDNVKAEKKDYKPLSKKNKIIMIIAIVFVTISLIIGLGAGIPISAYNYVKDGLAQFGYNRDEIGKKIQLMPYKYRDAASLREKYKTIMNEVTIIDEATLNNDDSEKCRKAYSNLVLLDELDYEINLKEYLKNCVFIDNLIYGIEWYSGGYYFKWSDSSDRQRRQLSTNLPNGKEDNKEYYYFDHYYYHDWVFGYENKNDSKDSFDAYRVTKVNIPAPGDGDMYITVYCYSNEQTYVLYST